ncbi:hypothetical protein [Sedimentibacter hydroxybenzoicus]|nr:hypothetical protein [Sedimentibacter hydroxybenzoicus]
MLKILLYGSIQERKILEEALQKPLRKKTFPSMFTIYQILSSS